MSRPVTPASAAPPTGTGTLSRSHSQRLVDAQTRPLSYVGGDPTGVEAHDYSSGVPQTTSMLSQSVGQDERPLNDAASSSGMQRSNSQMSQSATAIPSRGGTLKKKSSMNRTGSMKRSGSKRSSYAGSVRSMRLGEKEKYEPTEEQNSAFYCPVPISGSPTDLLADRFQGKLQCRNTVRQGKLTITSMAKGSERLDQLLPRSAKVVRSKSKVDSLSVECNQQHIDAKQLYDQRRFGRCGKRSS